MSTDAHGIAEDLQNNAAWRRDKAAEYPDDRRNVIAAEILERLMEEAGQLGDNNIQLLKLAGLSADLDGNRGLENLVDDISEYHRDIGFSRFPESIHVYLDDLIEIHQRYAKRDAKTLKSRVRRKAARIGYRVTKSRQRTHIPNSDNHGLYMLDRDNTVVLGSRYDASLEEIASYLDEVGSCLEEIEGDGSRWHAVAIDDFGLLRMWVHGDSEADVRDKIEVGYAIRVKAANRVVAPLAEWTIEVVAPEGQSNV
jgi:hypothetical protein